MLKGCLCHDKKHPRTWHCMVRKAGRNLVADFPFNHPKTYDTGLWERKEFHKIKTWGISSRKTSTQKGKA